MRLSRFSIRRPTTHSLLHFGHGAAHCTYLGAAAFHGGFYGLAAAILLILIILGLFLGEDLV